MRRAIFSASVAGLLVCGPAPATETDDFLIRTGADLARLCGAPVTDANFTAGIHMCHGYLVGVHQFHTALARTMEVPVYCLDRDGTPPTRAEAAAAYTAWISATPGAGEKPALDALLEWAATTYPCN